MKRLVNYRELNAKILQCSTALQIEALVLRTSDLDVVNLATAFRQLTYTKSASLETMHKLLRLSEPKQFPVRELSNICHAVAKSGLVQEMPQTLGSKAEEIDLSKCDPQSVSNVLWAFAKLRRPSPKLFTSFQGKHLETFRTQGLVNILWAHAVLGYGKNNLDLLERLSGELSKRSQLHPQDISNTLWAFASLNCYTAPITSNVGLGVFDEMVKHILDNRVALRSFQTVDLINTLWAFAVMKPSDPITKRLFEKLAQELIQRNGLEAREISKALWSFAIVKLTHHKLNQHLATQALAVADTFSAQDVSNTLWAFATLGIKHPGLFQSLLLDCNGASRDFAHFIPQALSNVLWALAKTEFKNPAAVKSLSNEVKRRDLATFSPQALCNILFSIATLGDKDVELCNKSCRELTKRNLGSEFTSQSISNMMWALASLGFKHNLLCHQVAQETDQLLSEFKPQALSNLLFALAVLDCGSTHREWIGKIATELCARQVEDFTLQGLTNSMWALACLDVLELPSVQQWFNNALPHTLENNSAAAQHQMFQAKLAWQQVNSKPFPLIESAPQRMCDPREVPFSSSKVHLTIAEVLRKTFPDLQNEVVLLGGVSVDMYIPSRNMVVEVDGPSHFFINQVTIPTGSTRFKYRMLERAGYRVCSISVRQYDLLVGEEKIDYFNQLISGW
ncbi:hypothetical protein BASA81_004844 [Batrachochytrium salamandrivorans]|nr:hypothetical protein BASA81_004844 [Batrachochytrium salamandrivorans]